MDNLYPSESQKLDFIGHLEELRQRIFLCLVFFLVAAIVMFSQGHRMMSLAKRPINGLVEELIFITPSEVFVSYIKISFLSAFFICFPIIWYQVFKFIEPAISPQRKANIYFWMFFAVMGFLVGLNFSYFIALPAALKFLLLFGKDVAVANITIEKYISFFTAFMLIGGMIFEIPIILGLLTEAGLIKSSLLKKKRKYALLIILIVAAVITPTQDIVNMMVFAVPMSLLYEVGIALAVFIEKGKKDFK